MANLDQLLPNGNGPELGQMRPNIANIDQTGSDRAEQGKRGQIGANLDQTGAKRGHTWPYGVIQMPNGAK